MKPSKQTGTRCRHVLVPAKPADIFGEDQVAAWALVPHDVLALVAAGMYALLTRTDCQEWMRRAAETWRVQAMSHKE